MGVQHGRAFLLIDARWSDGEVRVHRPEVTTRARAALARLRRAIPKIFADPFATIFAKPAADPVHGAARYSGALSRIVRRRVLDSSESAAADG